MELSKEILILISNEVKDLICILNHKLEVEYTNEIAFLKQLGYSSEDLIKKKFSNIIVDEKLQKN